MNIVFTGKEKETKREEWTWNLERKTAWKFRQENYMTYNEGE